MKNIISLGLLLFVGLTGLIPDTLALTAAQNARLRANQQQNSYYQDQYYQNTYSQNQYSQNGYYQNQYYQNSQNTYGNQPQVIYVYQTIPNGYSNNYGGGYPGCNRSDIIIGGQIWAACNVASRTKGSSSVSAWFFANDMRPSFVSSNGQGARLEWQGKVLSAGSWGDGPCAEGYRLPTRGEWETALFYARQNGVSVSSMLNLPSNGGYRGYKDTNSDVRIENRSDTLASYWSSTMSYNGGYYPTLMRIGSVYQGYRLDGTYNTNSTSGYNWQYTDSGLELVSGTSSDIANVRCIRK